MEGDQLNSMRLSKAVADTPPGIVGALVSAGELLLDELLLEEELLDELLLEVEFVLEELLDELLELDELLWLLELAASY